MLDRYPEIYAFGMRNAFVRAQSASAILADCATRAFRWSFASAPSPPLTAASVQQAHLLGLGRQRALPLDRHLHRDRHHLLGRSDPERWPHRQPVRLVRSHPRVLSLTSQGHDDVHGGGRDRAAQGGPHLRVRERHRCASLTSAQHLDQVHGRVSRLERTAIAYSSQSPRYPARSCSPARSCRSTRSSRPSSATR